MHTVPDSGEEVQRSGPHPALYARVYDVRVSVITVGILRW